MLTTTYLTLATAAVIATTTALVLSYHPGAPRASASPARATAGTTAPATARATLKAAAPADLPAVREMLLQAYRGRDQRITGKVRTTTMGTEVMAKTFSCETAGADLSLSWVGDHGPADKGAVTVGASGGTVTVADQPPQWLADPLTAIGAATGVSGTSAILMYGLWKGDLTSVLPERDVTVEQHGDDTVIAGMTSIGAKRTVIVSGGRLTLVRSEMPAQLAVLPQSTDEDIGTALRGLGQPSTTQDIAAARRSLEEAKSAIAASHAVVTFEVVFDAPVGAAPSHPATAPSEAAGPLQDG